MVKHYEISFLLLVALFCNLTVSAYDFQVDGIYYNKNGSETTVTYKSTNYNSYSGSVTIPSAVTYNGITYSVTSIGMHAFSDCRNLSSVIIPNSVTTIGDYAFYGCSGLTNITIPNSVTTIGDYAFYGCSGLTNITIPNSVTSIGGKAFYDCSGLIRVTIPRSIRSIGHSAFKNCSNLSGVYISDIEAWCNINFIYDSNDIDRDFSANPLNCAHHLYLNGTEVTELIIPSSVTSIRPFAFCGCTGITSVTIPSTVTRIGDNAFIRCSGLETLNFNAVSCDDFSYSNYWASYGYHPPFYGSNIKTINIGNSVEKLPAYFAYSLTNLTSVSIGYSITSIGRSAFYDCSGLTNVQIYDLRAWCNILFFDNTSNPLSSAHHLYLNGMEVKDLVIPNSINNIKSNAFSGCSGLTSVTIPNSVTSIGDYSFSNCSGLTGELTIPNSVTAIGVSAFSNCSGLTSVTIPDNVSSIESNAFYGCCGLTSITIPNSIPTIRSYTFSECTGLKNIIIPNSVTTIEQFAFYGCSGLTNITIPNSVTSIGSGAFQNCVSLSTLNFNAASCADFSSEASSHPFYNSNISTINFGDDVQKIPAYFAYRLTKLSSINIPNSISSISNYAFSDCSNLLSVHFPKTMKSIGNNSFSGCTKLTGVIFPNNLTTISNYAFYQCESLKNVIIPDAVTSIGDYAFNQCSSLVRVTISSHLTSLGKNSFSSCSALSSFSCMPVTPPVLDYSNSFNTYNTTSLYVPRSGVENYKTHTNWRRFAKIYEFVGNFTVPDVNVTKGKTVVIPVSMTNEADIIGFQTDIYLPEGFEFVKDGVDYVVDPSDRMARDHSIMCNVSDDGALRVLCFSPTNKVISGNEGELFYVTIKAPDDSVGDFSLCFKNTILTTSDAEELLSPDAYSNINVIPYLPGDANGNGEVSVIDIVTSAQYIIFQNPDPFLFEAADLNNDDQITVTDLALIANLILYPTMDAPKRVPAFDLSMNQIYGNDIQLNTGETQTVTITLDNLEEYSAFQMDVKSPSGLTASNFSMENQSGSHSLITSEGKDGIIRVLCYSPSLADLGNDEKILLTFDVTSTGNIAGNIIVDGIELVTTTCQPVHLDAFEISVNQSSTVNEVSSGKSIAQIEYYNLAGQKLAEPTQGVTIVVTTYTDGSRTTQKVIK